MVSLERLFPYAFAVIGLIFFPAQAWPCSRSPQFYTIPADADFYVPLNGKIQFASFQIMLSPKLYKQGKEVPAKIVPEVREAIYFDEAGYITTFNTLETAEPLEPETLYKLVLDPEDEMGTIHFVTGKTVDTFPPKIQSAKILRIDSREGNGGSMCDYGGVANEVTLEIKTSDQGNAENFIFYNLYLVKAGETVDFEKPYLYLGYGLADFKFHFPEDKNQNYSLYIIAEDIHGFKSDPWGVVFASVAEGREGLTEPIDFSRIQAQAIDDLFRDPNLASDVVNSPAAQTSSSCMNLGSTNRSGSFFLLLPALLLTFMIYRYRLRTPNV